MGKNPVRQKQAKGACDKMGKLSKARLPRFIKSPAASATATASTSACSATATKPIGSTATASTAASEETSIGPYPEVSLDAARVRHAALRKQVIADKIDPLEQRMRKATAPALAPVPTFGQVADAYLSPRTRRLARNPQTASLAVGRDPDQTLRADLARSRSTSSTPRRCYRC